MAELPKSVRDGQVAAVLARIESYAAAQERYRGTIPAADLAGLYVDAANVALLGACEVREERGFRLACRPGRDALEYFELESHVAEAFVRHHQRIYPDAQPEPIRRLVITTAAEDITEKVSGRG